MRPFVRPTLLAGLIIATTAGVVACGGGSSSTTASSTASAASSASASASPSGSDGRNRADPFANSTVQACLSAAGIAVPTVTRPTGTGSFARPSGSFSRPSGSFTRPSGSFTRPSGAGSGGFGGGFGGTESTEIQQALTACGITLPTGGGRGSGAEQPSGAPTS